MTAPKKYSVTAGVGLPIFNKRTSFVNIGLEWVRRSPSVANQITENYFMLNFGVTFNEEWFRKYKIQ